LKNIIERFVKEEKLQVQ